MGSVEGGEQLRRVLELAEIDRLVLGMVTTEVIPITPKAIVEQIEKTIRYQEKLPASITVCSSTIRTFEGLRVIHEWFEAKKNQQKAKEGSGSGSV
jgi:hypothetical protein